MFISQHDTIGYKTTKNGRKKPHIGEKPNQKSDLNSDSFTEACWPENIARSAGQITSSPVGH